MIDTNTQMMIDERLNRIVKNVEQAIYESEIAVGDIEKGYPYAAGYARSALKSVLDDIELLQSYLQIEA